MASQIPQSPSQLGAEREKLLAAGLTDAEASKILFARHGGVTQAAGSTVSAGHGAMTGVASNLAAAAGYVANFGPSVVIDIMTMINRTATPTERGQAFAKLVTKAVVATVIAYILFMEFSQFQSATSRAQAEACSARMKAIIDTVPMEQWGAANRQLDKDCANSYVGGETQHATHDALTDFFGGSKQASEASKDVLSPAGEALLQDLKQLKATPANHYPEHFSIAQSEATHAATWEREQKGAPGNLTYGALIRVSFYGLFVHQYSKALDAANSALSMHPSDLVPETNRAHALMFLGRTSDARTIYLKHRGQKLDDKKTWEEAIADDFSLLREEGLSNPLMAEVESAFKRR